MANTSRWSSAMPPDLCRSAFAAWRILNIRSFLTLDYGPGMANEKAQTVLADSRRTIRPQRSNKTQPLLKLCSQPPWARVLDRAELCRESHSSKDWNAPNEGRE